MEIPNEHGRDIRAHDKGSLLSAMDPGRNNSRELHWDAGPLEIMRISIMTVPKVSRRHLMFRYMMGGWG